MNNLLRTILFIPFCFLFALNLADLGDWLSIPAVLAKNSFKFTDTECIERAPFLSSPFHWRGRESLL